MSGLFIFQKNTLKTLLHADVETIIKDIPRNIGIAQCLIDILLSLDLEQKRFMFKIGFCVQVITHGKKTDNEDEKNEQIK
jgi:hypothetical protein